MNEARDEVQRLETLIQINSLINSQYRDVRVLLSHIMDSAERLIGSDASALLLVDAETGKLSFEVASGEKGEDVKKHVLAPGEGIAGWVVQNNRSFLTNDAPAEPRHSTSIGTETGYRTRNLIAVPLRARNQVIGVLETINKTHGDLFNDEDLRFLEVLADQASIAIQNAWEHRRLTQEVERLKSPPSSTSHHNEKTQAVWESPSSQKLLQTADRMAASTSPVLIMGESGTGKELLAERIHGSSAQAQGPLVKVNCAAIPSELLESELFGHVKGAFTDAMRDRTGHFERARGGSLFLDEVAELPLHVQGKLLRVLQTKRFLPLGAEEERETNARVIVATNRVLEEAVSNGTFREDLYYRLAVLPLRILPLHQRPEDILALAQLFLKEFHSKMRTTAEELETKEREFSLEAQEALLSYRWPGNVRELRNAIERSMVHSAGRTIIQPDDLGLPGESSLEQYHGRPLKEAVALFKKNVVQEALRAHNGNQTEAARALGIQRTYLSRMLRDMNIDRRGDET
ncbi:MAG: sigma-54-dependent Fis family transcriptional regulator [Spirochaetales bacterium]|nr:sigma-54-dependent Fis family transcriptional regulator [Spirochaetales bacterium]